MFGIPFIIVDICYSIISNIKLCHINHILFKFLISVIFLKDLFCAMIVIPNFIILISYICFSFLSKSHVLKPLCLKCIMLLLHPFLLELKIIFFTFCYGFSSLIRINSLFELHFGFILIKKKFLDSTLHQHELFFFLFFH
jgi:hypothetical protein